MKVSSDALVGPKIRPLKWLLHWLAELLLLTTMRDFPCHIIHVFCLEYEIEAVKVLNSIEYIRQWNP